MRRGLSIPLALVALVGAGVVIAVAAGGKDDGRIGPDNQIQPSGRLLKPVGKTTELGNLPTGGALSPDGRLLFSLAAGRGLNEIEVVRVRANVAQCGKPGNRRRSCVRKKRRSVGKVLARMPLPGLSGGIAVHPDKRVIYVSGTPASERDDGAVPEGTPGTDGDVIHVIGYRRSSGKLQHKGLIEVPPPAGTPPPQNFPPTNTRPLSWPQDLAISPDGKTLLAALNLADNAAVIDLASGSVDYVPTGRFPRGAAITADGRWGLISNEVPGTVSVIDLADASKEADIQVGPYLSHPSGIAVDPKADRAFVAVNQQDLIAVIDTAKMEVERTLSVERKQGIGTSPTGLSVDRFGCRLLSANSGEDAIAVFALRTGKRCRAGGRKPPRKRVRVDRILQREAAVGLELTESEKAESAEIFGEEAEEIAERRLAKEPAQRKGKKFQLIGRIPVASYPVAAFTTPQRGKGQRLVWLTAKGLGVGRNDAQGRTLPEDEGSATSGQPPKFRFDYLPSNVFGMSGIMASPSDRRLRKLTPKAARQLKPLNSQKPPPDTPLRADGPIDYVFYIVRENRTYDQILGDDPRGDGDPKLTLFGEDVTPNAHALARRFPLLDHVYANSEASIDGHFWTSAAAVSDYVVRSWHANYAGRQRPYDFGVYSVTWPSQRFLFDQATKQGISWFNYGEAIAGTVPLNDRDRRPRETAEVAAKFAQSDLGQLAPGPQLDPPAPCFANNASSGGTNVISMQEVFDSSRPPGANPANTESRFECFKERFEQQLADGEVPAFNYITLPNDHTAGTTPGARTPTAMIAENDLALGEIVDLISNSEIWERSLILVIEDDSQDGADHVDAHRIPALAISPYTKRGAVVSNRYDFLSFIRTLELVLGMKPLNLFDATAVPLYDAFDSDPSDNDEPYDAIVPDVNLLERNTESSPNAELSEKLPLQFTDRTPQRMLDRILWQSVHGPDSEPPPPGPNASGLDEAAWRRHGGLSPEEALEEVYEELLIPYLKRYRPKDLGLTAAEAKALLERTRAAEDEEAGD